MDEVARRYATLRAAEAIRLFARREAEVMPESDAKCITENAEYFITNNLKTK